MKKIRIVNIVSKLVFGGVESVIYNYYSNMDLSQFELYIITRNDSNKQAAEKFEKLGFNIIYVDNWEKNPLKMFKVLKKIFMQYKFDIIHSHLSHTNFYFMYLAKKCSIPVRISHSHLSITKEKFLSKIKHKFYSFVIKKYSTDLVACGRDAAESLYGKREDVVIFNNAIQLENYNYNEKIRKDYRGKFNIDNDDICLCCIGRMTYQKNHTFMIDVFKAFHDKVPSSKLILVGDGDLRESIINKIENYLLSDSVILLKNRDDIPNLLSMCDVFCLPSLYEGLPVVGVEAQAAGLLCYFSDTTTAEAKILDSTKFMSLFLSPEIWADNIFNDFSSFKRSNTLTKMTQYGFNIKEEAKKLENYYINKVK